MKLIGLILAASIALAAFKAAMVVLIVIYPLALLWAVTTKPTETFGFLIFFIVMFLLDNHPVVTIGAVVVLCMTGMVSKRLWGRS